MIYSEAINILQAEQMALTGDQATDLQRAIDDCNDLLGATRQTKEAACEFFVGARNVYDWKNKETVKEAIDTVYITIKNNII